MQIYQNYAKVHRLRRCTSWQRSLAKTLKNDVGETPNVSQNVYGLKGHGKPKLVQQITRTDLEPKPNYITDDKALQSLLDHDSNQGDEACE